MTIAGDLAAALSTRLGCSMGEARAHIEFIMECANDPNFALRFAHETEQEYPYGAYHDVVRFLHDTA